MALIKCKECGATISDKANVCPKCGCPTEHDNLREESEHEDQEDAPKRFGKLWIAIGVLVLAFIVGGSITYFKMGRSDASEDTINKDSVELPTARVVKLTPEFCMAVQKYNCLWDFKDGFAAVENGEKWGFIDTEGKEIVPCSYDMVSSFNEELAAVCKNNKWGYVNTKGKLVIPCIYDYVNDFSEGLASVSKNKKEGFIDKEGKVVIPFIYKRCGIFSEGLAYAGDKKGNYFINKKGEIKIRLPKGFSLFEGSAFDCLYPTFYKGTCNIIVGDDYSYFINTKGEKVQPKSETSVSAPTYDYEVFRNEQGLVGVKNIKTNKIVVQAKYSSIGESGRGNDIIKLHNGVVVATLDYKELKETTEESSYSEYNIDFDTDYHSLYGYIDMKGNETFTSKDYKFVADKNTKYEQDKNKRQEEQENQVQEYNGDNTDSYNEYNSNEDSYPFDTDQDVIAYTSGSFKSPDGTRISIKYDGFYVDGNKTPTFAPVVTSFNSTMARIKINVIPTGTVYFTVDKARGGIIDIDGTFWKKK